MDEQTPNRPFSEMREHGLLWLINATVFHPRGFALAFDVDDNGTVTGWGVMGDGTEPWHFADPPDMDPSDPQSIDSKFAAAEAFLAAHRPSALVASEPLDAAQLAELKERFLAAQGQPPEVLR